MKYLLIIFALFPQYYLHITNAQIQHNWWSFGDNIILDFTTGIPVTQNPTNFQNYITSITSACVSDVSGDVLMYTDGNQIFDKNHIVMSNGQGLLGSNSATQGALIVPQPGADGMYYIFTVDRDGGANGLRYSIVDQRMNNNTGTVTAKNILLHPSSAEKLTAVDHNNGYDKWIISHDWNSNVFRAYLLTCSGLDSIPVLSSTGSIHQGGSIGGWLSGINNNAKGWMVGSHDGNKLAVSILDTCVVEIFDFDKSTGLVSYEFAYNPTRSGGNNYSTYGVEFSPDNTKLYVSVIISNTSNTTGMIYQLDLSAGSISNILNSEALIGQSPSNSFPGALQLAPDGKIYVAQWSSTVGVIHLPNTVGLNCNFDSLGISLHPNGEDQAWNLPNFPRISYNDIDTTDFSWQMNCNSGRVQFYINDTVGITGLSWDFGDPNSGWQNYSSLYNENHIYSQSGTYGVQLNYEKFGCRKSSNKRVVIPGLSLGEDQTICKGQSDSLLLDATNSGALNYLWDNGLITSMRYIDAPGEYSVEVNFGMGCVLSDTVRISQSTIPEVNLGDDFLVCEKSSCIRLSWTQNRCYTYEWSELFPIYIIRPGGGGRDTSYNTSIVGTNTSLCYSPGFRGERYISLCITDTCTGCSSCDTVKVTIVPDNHPKCRRHIYHDLCCLDAITDKKMNTYAFSKDELAMRIYPNPSNTRNVQLEINCPQSGIANIAVFNLLGKIVYTNSFECSKGFNTIEQLQLPENSSGVYQIRITQNNSIESSTLFLR